MTTRLVGLGLIAIGIVFGVMFVYFPIRDHGDGFMGLVSIKALVFVPLAIVTGLSFVIGGTPVLIAFQARQKTKQQLRLVLSIIVGAGIISGITFWQVKTRWLVEPEPLILQVPPMPPRISQPPMTPPTVTPPR